MDDATVFLTIEWGFNFLLMIVVGVGGFFVRRLSEDMARRNEQFNELTHRVVVLEERARGASERSTELKTTIDALAEDMRFVRESVAVLMNKAAGADAGG